MELRAYLREVWRYALVVVLVVLVASGTAFAVTSMMAKSYTAEARMVVTAGLGVGGGQSEDILTAPRLGQTYAVLATTRTVLQEVICRIDLPYDPAQLAELLTVTADVETPFLVISMTDASPSVAALTANTTADVLVTRGTTTATPETPSIQVLEIVERAAVPGEPSAPRVLFTTALSAAAALVTALVILALGQYLRSEPRVRQPANG